MTRRTLLAYLGFTLWLQSANPMTIFSESSGEVAGPLGFPRIGSEG